MPEYDKLSSDRLQEKIYGELVFIRWLILGVVIAVGVTVLFAIVSR